MNVTTYRLSHTDNSNCRVYYKAGRKLRCFQEDRPNQFTFYICSADGEPEYEVKPPPLAEFDRCPEDDSRTAQSFRAWFKTRNS